MPSSAVRSFAPIVPPRPRLLVLGSMPGVESLRQTRYYAHPRNGFWPIMMDFLGEDLALPYRSRMARLKRAGVALWDVLAQCERKGSLDADIQTGSERPNDIAGLLAAHPGIAAVATNGGKASTAFARHILPQLPEARRRALIVHALPSTSPANARMRFDEKRRLWHAFLKDAL